MLPNYRVSLILALVGTVCFQCSISSATVEPDSEQNALQRASEWLMARRNSDYHWGPGTPMALLALSRIPTWNRTSLESRLSIQQLDVDFLFNKLNRKDSIGERIFVTQTLTSLCGNVNDYYGYDLPKRLFLAEESDFTFATELLTACVANAAIRKSHVARLIELVDPAKWTDVDNKAVAMIGMATECLRHRYKNTNYLWSHSKDLFRLMKEKQQKNGSFDDNVITTALYIQAMQADSVGLDVDDAQQSAMTWLRRVQKEDGSFGSLLETTEAVLALSPMKGRIHLDSQCAKHLTRIDNFDYGRSLDQKVSLAHVPGQKVVNVHFRIGEGTDPVNKMKDINATVLEDANIYQILKEIARSNENFKFEFKESAIGQYLSSIDDHKDGPAGYWMIYRLPSGREMSDSDGREALQKYLLTTSIDATQPLDDETILLWFKEMH